MWIVVVWPVAAVVAKVAALTTVTTVTLVIDLVDSENESSEGDHLTSDEDFMPPTPYSNAESQVDSAIGNESTSEDMLQLDKSCQESEVKQASRSKINSFMTQNACL